MIKTRVSLFVALPLLLALSGCEIKKCEGDECDFDFDDDDAGENNGGGADGGTTGGKDGGGTTGGKDGGGTTGSVMTLEQFCTAQLSAGAAWAAKVDECCDDGAEAAEVRDFVKDVLIYPDAAVDRCLGARKPAIDAGTVKFEPSSALKCAQAYVAAFALPPATCGGYDLNLLEGMIGHGAPALSQIRECRAAFVGTIASGKACTGQFECVATLRCLPMSGSGATNKACQSALGKGAACTVSSDCDDGLTCVGNSQGAGRTCLPSNDLALAGNCQGSNECVEGRLCSASNLCAPAVSSGLICEKP